MADMALIQKICNLSCEKKDVVINQTALQYDTDNPFLKYYRVGTVQAAIQKYLCGEWDEVILAHWATLYFWVLAGGYEDSLRENLTSFERFFKDIVINDLDSLSFYSESEPWGNLDETVKLFDDYDCIWQTRSAWRVVYAMLSEDDEENDCRWYLLMNETEKAYMIVCHWWFEKGLEDCYFHCVKREEYIGLVERLKREGYRILPCAEKFYEEEINSSI